MTFSVTEVKDFILKAIECYFRIIKSISPILSVWYIRFSLLSNIKSTFQIILLIS